MQLSIIVPLYNEEESLPELVSWIDKVMQSNNYSHEIIMVDDGSTDTSWSVVKNLKAAYPAIKGIKFKRNQGKSAALNTAFEAAQGTVVITMDADLQDSPEEIPELYSLISEENYDLVSGWKKERHDPITKTIPTKLYNWATRVMSGIKLHDMNCGLKAYRNEVVKNVEVYGEMHRYIPVLAKTAGYTKIGEKVVQHQARKYGVTKFGLNRFTRGFLDLMSITFIGKFGKRPMHFFGSIGLLCSFMGSIMLAVLTYQKIFKEIGGIAERPLFFLGMLLIIVGVQLFIAGFLAEMISRNNHRRNEYPIAETI